MITINQLVQGSSPQKTPVKNDSLPNEGVTTSFEDVIQNGELQSIPDSLGSDLGVSPEIQSLEISPETQSGEISPEMPSPDKSEQTDIPDLTDPLVVLSPSLHAHDELSLSVEARAFSGELTSDMPIQETRDVEQATDTLVSSLSTDGAEKNVSPQQLGISDASSYIAKSGQELAGAQIQVQAQDPLHKAGPLTVSAHPSAQTPTLEASVNSTFQPAPETAPPLAPVTSSSTAQTGLPLETLEADTAPSTIAPTQDDANIPATSQTQKSASFELATNVSNVELGTKQSLTSQVGTTGAPIPLETTPGATQETNVMPPNMDDKIVSKPNDTGQAQANILPNKVQDIAVTGQQTSTNIVTDGKPPQSTTAQPTLDVGTSPFTPPAPSQPPPETRAIKTSTAPKGDTSSSTASSPVTTTVTANSELGTLNLQELTSGSDAEPDVLDGMADELLPLIRGNDFNSLPQMLTEASVRASSTHYGAENPRLIGQQLAEAVISHDGDQVEVALNPAELGKVNMRLTTTDVGVMIVIQAERPETEDLMRRHINELMKEFKEMGFTDIGFEFSNGGGTSKSHETDNGSDGGIDADDSEDDFERMPEELLAQLNIAADGLDIRI